MVTLAASIRRGSGGYTLLKSVGKKRFCSIALGSSIPHHVFQPVKKVEFFVCMLFKVLGQTVVAVGASSVGYF